MTAEQQVFAVSGLTCAHCVAAVTEEVSALAGVSTVSIELEPAGVSTLTVHSTSPLDPVALAAALDEAGNYQLA